jgi:hypothetical protein
MQLLKNPSSDNTHPQVSKLLRNSVSLLLYAAFNALPVHKVQICLYVCCFDIYLAINYVMLWIVEANFIANMLTLIEFQWKCRRKNEFDLQIILLKKKITGFKIYR